MDRPKEAKAGEREVTSFLKLVYIDLIFCEILKHLSSYDIKIFSCVNKDCCKKSREYLHIYRTLYLRVDLMDAACSALLEANELFAASTAPVPVNALIVPSGGYFPDETYYKNGCVHCTPSNDLNIQQLYPALFRNLRIKRLELMPVGGIGVCMTWLKFYFEIFRVNFRNITTLDISGRSIPLSETQRGPISILHNPALRIASESSQLVFSSLKVINVWSMSSQMIPLITELIQISPNLKAVSGEVNFELFTSLETLSLSPEHLKLFRNVGSAPSGSSKELRRLTCSPLKLSYMVLAFYPSWCCDQIWKDSLTNFINNSAATLRVLQCSIYQLIFMVRNSALQPFTGLRRLAVGTVYASSGEVPQLLASFNVYDRVPNFSEFEIKNSYYDLNVHPMFKPPEYVVGKFTYESVHTADLWGVNNTEFSHFVKLFPSVQNLTAIHQFWRHIPSSVARTWNLKALSLILVQSLNFDWNQFLSCANAGLQVLTLTATSSFSDADENGLCWDDDHETQDFVSADIAKAVQHKHPGLVMEIRSKRPTQYLDKRELQKIRQTLTGLQPTLLTVAGSDGFTFKTSLDPNQRGLLELIIKFRG